MSSIWTPGGEHRVPPGGEGGRGGGPRGAQPPGPGAAAGPADVEEPELTEEERARLEEAAEEVAAVRAQLAAAPAEQVVANHVIGLYELAAIHLARQPPDLTSSRLAIDALAAVLDACQGRLGDLEPTLSDARSQIQLAFVAASRPPGAPG